MSLMNGQLTAVAVHILSVTQRNVYLLGVFRLLEMAQNKAAGLGVSLSLTLVWGRLLGFSVPLRNAEAASLPCWALRVAGGPCSAGARSGSQRDASLELAWGSVGCGASLVSRQECGSSGAVFCTWPAGSFMRCLRGSACGSGRKQGPRARGWAG